MLAIHVELLHDTFRATPADDLSLSGATPTAEWPPSPARLFSALVAAGGSGQFSRSPFGDADLEMLEQAAPPIIWASGSAAAPESAIFERYAVVDERATNFVQNYPARTAQIVRPGARRAPRERSVVFVFDDVDLTADQLTELRYRSARVGYLGCSDSPARVRVCASTAEIDGVDSLATWAPHVDGEVDLPVPYPGFLAALDESYEAWRVDRQPTRRAWIRNHLVGYRDMSVGRARVRPQPHYIWLRFDRAVGGRRVVRVTQALRAAALQKYEHFIARSPEAVPAVLHGHHAADERGYDHASYLALPHVGPRGDGRIRGACIVLPHDTEPEVVEGVRVAVGGGAWSLHDGDFFQVNVTLHDGNDRPWSTNPKRWTRPATEFVSAFPAVHERYSKGKLSLAEIARWCTNAGFPEPIDARWAKVPLIEGAVALSPSEVTRHGDDARPFSHVALTFAEPVRGPIAIGRGRHFGLGLLVPTSRHDEERDV